MRDQRDVRAVIVEVVPGHLVGGGGGDGAKVSSRSTLRLIGGSAEKAAAKAPVCRTRCTTHHQPVPHLVHSCTNIMMQASASAPSLSLLGYELAHMDARRSTHITSWSSDSPPHSSSAFDAAAAASGSTAVPIKHRSVADWKLLLDDAGLMVHSMVSTGGPLTIIEAVPSWFE